MPFRPSIVYKVFATLVAATTLLVVSMWLFVQWSFERGFVQFVEAREANRREQIVTTLSELYAARGNWRSVLAHPWQLRQLMEPRPGPSRGDVSPEPGAGRPEDRGPTAGPERRLRLRPGLGLGRGLVLLDAEGRPLLGRPREPERLELYPIEVDDGVVGYLGQEPRPTLAEVADLRFVERQNQNFVAAAIGILLVSLIMSLPLARALAAPLRRVAAAARSLAAGRYSTRLPVTSADEIGQLATDFNGLAATLESNQRARRQWVADISHELRTPLSVLRGEIESVQDGVRPLDQGVMASLHTEVMHLGALVDQLYQLTLHDAGAVAYQKSAVAPVELLRRDVEALRSAFQERGIDLSVDLDAADAVPVNADADKLSQVFRNLLSNSLKHTAPGGRARVCARVDGGDLLLTIEDSAPGVPAEALAHLFERFYRADPSRSRETGGAGLGLAITRSIVEAHGGRVSALASPLGGLALEVRLPVLRA